MPPRAPERSWRGEPRAGGDRTPGQVITHKHCALALGLQFVDREPVPSPVATWIASRVTSTIVPGADGAVTGSWWVRRTMIAVPSR
jgi:hypothetical protein